MEAVEVVSNQPEGLEKAVKRQKAACRQYLEHVPKMFKDTFKRATLGRGGFRDCVNAMCQQCVGYEQTVTSVRYCTAFRCPLWQKRPYQEAKGAD